MLLKTQSEHVARERAHVREWRALAFVVVKFQQAVMDIRHDFARKLCMQKAHCTGVAHVPVECDPQASGCWLAIFGACFLRLLLEKRHVEIPRESQWNGHKCEVIRCKQTLTRDAIERA